MRIVLLLGGGGMKGLAHIGVLKALEKLDLQVSDYVGTSVGAIISALAACGVSPVRMEERALSLRKRDLLDPSFWGMIFRRRNTAALFKGGRLEAFIRETIPIHHFDQIPRNLFVNTININTGATVIWGLPGLRYVSIPDAVTASCALPGVFPPKLLGNDFYVDGGIGQDLLINLARFLNPDLIIAVSLKSIRPLLSGNGLKGQADESTGGGRYHQKLSAVLAQVDAIRSQIIIEKSLHSATDLPLVLIRPVDHECGVFDFSTSRRLIDLAERETLRVLTRHPLLNGNGGRERGMFLGRDSVENFPRFTVDSAACIGCTACVFNCPVGIYETRDGKGHYNEAKGHLCTTDLFCIRNCPTGAISLRAAAEPQGV